MGHLDVFIHRLRPAFLEHASVAVGWKMITAPAAARTPYDGDWSVAITTRSGGCDPAFGTVCQMHLCIQAESGFGRMVHGGK